MNDIFETRLAGLFVLAVTTALTTSALAQAPGAPAGNAQTAKTSPVVESIVGAPPLHLKILGTSRAAHPARRRTASHRRRHDHGLEVERPALAGVVLVEPLRRTVAPPRDIVPLPAYFVDGVVADFTTPEPAIVCEHRPREHGLPDPHLYREVPLACAYEAD